MYLKEEEYSLLLKSKIKDNVQGIVKLLLDEEVTLGLMEQVNGMHKILYGLVVQKERLPYIKKLFNDNVVFTYDETYGELGYIGLDEEEWEKLMPKDDSKKTGFA